MEEMVTLFLPFFFLIPYLRPPKECITYIKGKNERNNYKKRQNLRKKNYFCIQNPMIRDVKYAGKY